MKIQIREVDDWVCVFKDGELVYSNHSCSIRDGLDALGLEYEHEYLDPSEYPDDEDFWAQDWVETLGASA